MNIKTECRSQRVNDVTERPTAKMSEIVEPFLHCSIQAKD